MSSHTRIVGAAGCLLLTAACSGESPLTAEVGPTASESARLASDCGLTQPAFCDSFDAPSPVTNRSGQLNGVVWGVSRAIGAVNWGQGQYDAWGLTQLQNCNGTSVVQPPQDVIVCNGQLREAVNDMHGVTTLSMYPKQPFDFAGRTGTITFDVSNDTLGTHTEWPELWITDQPVPTPFTFENIWLAAPRHALGLRLSAEVGPNQGAILSPNCPNDKFARWSVSSAVAVRNYVIDDQDMGGGTRVQIVGCVTRSAGPGHMNRVQVKVSTSQIDVYASDADTTAPLKHIAVVSNANLSFTRGLIWIADAHYNAEKGGGATQHTFSWDNVGFDGPLLPRDLTFDAPDALQSRSDGSVNLGWFSAPGSGHPFTIPNVTSTSNASAALLTFNAYHYDAPSSFTYVVNGHSHVLSWPYPDKQGYTWRTVAAPVPLSDIVSGTNTVNVYSTTQPLAIANADFILVGAGGVVSP